MARRLLDYDHFTGTATYHHYDHQSKQTIIETVHDCSPVLERNKILTNKDDAKKQIKNNWWHVASIPIGVQHKWLVDHGVNIFKKDHWGKVKKLLKDPDYKYLKTTTGKF